MSVAGNINLKLRSLQVDFEEFKEEFKEFASKSEGRFNKFYDLMDGLAGEFKKFDEEQVVLSGKQSKHSDRLEKLEKRVFSHTLS